MCVQAFAGHAGTRVVTFKDFSSAPSVLLEGAGGLLLTGGPDIAPVLDGEEPHADAEVRLCSDLERLELGLLGYALERDMPVLAICRGMQLVNVAFRGKLLGDVPGHGMQLRDGQWESSRHLIYLSPGSKLAAILGMGGFFRVNSRHHQGLREAQKARGLLASAYSVDDGVIEGLESPDHSWVVGVQCCPEHQGEVPPAFANLFEAFAERAEDYEKSS